jgi:uncharacterized membrane protein
MAIAMMSWMIAIPLLGAMTGLRTMTPMAVVCWFAWRHHLALEDTWGFWAGNLITVAVFTVLGLGELIGDKLPQTPSRLDAGPLAARVAFGGLVGALCATGLHGSAVEGVLLGVIGAFAGAFFGYHLRAGLKHKHGWPDLPIAVAEDVIAITASVLAMGIVTG